VENGNDLEKRRMRKLKVDEAGEGEIAAKKPEEVEGEKELKQKGAL